MAQNEVTVTVSTPSAKHEQLITSNPLQGAPPGRKGRRQHIDEKCVAANRVTEHPTRVPSSMTGLQQGLRNLKGNICRKELKAFEPQKGEAISRAHRHC